MATKILKTWIEDIWSKFNAVISNYSDNLSQMTTNFDKIKASDINITLSDKIAEMKNDYYLSTEADLFTAYAVTQGETISSDIKTNYDEEVNNFSVLICKNTVSFSNGTVSCSHGSKSNSYNSNSSYNRGINNSYCTSIVQESRSSNSNGGSSSTISCSHGTHTNAATCSPNQTGINLRCSKTTGTSA